MITRGEIRVVRDNWNSWKDVWEHQGEPWQNPLLVDGERFARFTQEYSVQRTIRKGAQEELRPRLLHQRSLKALLHDHTGQALDRLVDRLSQEFGTHDPPRRMTSVISKVAAFLAPHAFTAWDRYARSGLSSYLGAKQSETYADYLEKVNTSLDGDLGKEVRIACARYYPSEYARKQNRFHRRVLDVHLMIRGGRSLEP